MVSLLRHYGIRASIVGFKSDAQAAHESYGQQFIFDWVWDYFTDGCVLRLLNIVATLKSDDLVVALVHFVLAMVKGTCSSCIEDAHGYFSPDMTL